MPDWPLLWKQLVEVQTGAMKKKEDRAGDSWAEKARSFDEGVKRRWSKPDSTRRFLVDLLKAHPGSSVLDIGAGTGSWACMLAPHAVKVTALEPSPAMIAVMEEKIRELGIGNVEIIQDSWPGACVDDHDFSLCSHAMYGSTDFPFFVQRMNEVTRRCCLLLMRAPTPDGIMAKIAREVWGQPHDSPNFQIAYNILLQMGIFANVLMEDSGQWKPWTNDSLDEAVAEVKRKLGLDGHDSHDPFIRKILQENLTLDDGRLSWPSGVCSALAYWFKHPLKRLRAVKRS